MRRIAFVGMAVCLVGWVLVSAQGRVPTAQCLHERDERPAERTRRQAAIRFAQVINRAESASGAPFGQRLYRPLEQLTNVPPVPDGFRLQFQTNGTAYGFSLKDERDACGYAIFSDQDGLIYEAMPSQATGIVPATNDPQPNQR
jgi:hypothetical protein